MNRKQRRRKKRIKLMSWSFLLLSLIHILDILFGEGHELTPIKDLSQPGQFACDEKVDLVGPKRTIKGVRILGPARKETQVEISLSDGFTLGLEDVPVRDSGKIDGTPGLKLCLLYTSRCV